jgi:hypothetical protein
VSKKKTESKPPTECVAKWTEEKSMKLVEFAPA